jgi:signal peptidase
VSGSARAIASWGGQVIAWFVILGAVAILAAAVVVPRLGGATPYTVLTSSMEPGLPPGTLVVVRPVPIEEVSTGDVITYQLESGDPTVVTHRVVGLSTTLGGEKSLITQGDSNDIPDAAPVQPVQVKGRLWYSVPYIGRVSNVINGDQRQVGVSVVVVALLGYAGLMLAGSVRERRRRRPVEAEAPAENHTTSV